MNLTGNDIAGIVDIFGGLTRGELGEALAELAFKQGEEYDPSEFADEIDAVIDSYQLVSLDPQSIDTPVDDSLLVPGPAAFPTIPEQSQDLRHILDIEERQIDRDTAGEAAADRLHEAAVIALRTEDDEEIDRLIDLSYEIETWAPVELDETRRLMEDGL